MSINATLFLDLDHTLIHSVKKDKDKINKPDCIYDNYNVYFRTDLHNFMEFCFNFFERVVIWTAATDNYAHSIIGMFNLQFEHNYYRIITRDTYGQIDKDMSLVMTDSNIKDNPLLFIDDYPERIININKHELIVADKYKYGNSDKFLSDTQENIIYTWAY